MQFPLGTTDFGSYLLTAIQAKPQVVALAMGGNDMTNAIKGASEFGLGKSGAVLAAFGLTELNVRTIGLEAAQGVVTLAPFLWNRDETSMRFARAFKSRADAFPSYVQAGAYSAARSYFQAVQDIGTAKASAVVARLRETVINDAFTTNGTVRKDGLLSHDMYLVTVKSPQDSTNVDDLFKLEGVVPGSEAYRPVSESECPLVHH